MLHLMHTANGIIKASSPLDAYRGQVRSLPPAIDITGPGGRRPSRLEISPWTDRLPFPRPKTSTPSTRCPVSNTYLAPSTQDGGRAYLCLGPACPDGGEALTATWYRSVLNPYRLAYCTVRPTNCWRCSFVKSERDGQRSPT